MVSRMSRGRRGRRRLKRQAWLRCGAVTVHIVGVQSSRSLRRSLHHALAQRALRNQLTKKGAVRPTNAIGSAGASRSTGRCPGNRDTLLESQRMRDEGGAIYRRKGTVTALAIQRAIKLPERRKIFLFAHCKDRGRWTERSRGAIRLEPSLSQVARRCSPLPPQPPHGH